MKLVRGAPDHEGVVGGQITRIFHRSDVGLAAGRSQARGDAPGDPPGGAVLARIHDKNRHLDHRPFHDRARRREPPRAECPLPAGPVTMRAANLIRGSRATVTDCDPNEEREPPSVRQRLLGGGPALARRSGHYVGPKGAMTFDHPNNADERASVLPGQCGVLFGRCIWLAYSPGRRRWKIGSPCRGLKAGSGTLGA